MAIPASVQNSLYNRRQQEHYGNKFFPGFRGAVDQRVRGRFLVPLPNIARQRGLSRWRFRTMQAVMASTSGM
jgi:hypothetical protein